jgi:serine/threonine protein kinase
MDLQPEMVLHERYRIIEKLGQGGMGAVYLAWARANDYDNDNDVLFERTPLTGVAGRPPEASRRPALRAWPNPCWPGQSVRMTGAGQLGTGAAGIYDVSGRLVSSVPFEGGGPETTVRTDGLAPGVYLIRCGPGTGSCVKLVIAR